jgi:GT2 family glycosyltransferase
VIVDNNSSDGTQAWLMDLATLCGQVRPLFLDQNYGGAGGFHYGIRRAYDHGADWIWTLDDDSIPEKDALKHLLDFLDKASQGESPPIGFLASEVNWIDGNRHRMNVPGAPGDWSSGHPRIPGSTKVCATTFVSMLLGRAAVSCAGYPVKEFFLWFDDVEYSLRICDHGFTNYYVPASRVCHATATNESGADYCSVTPENLWRYKIGSRNRIAYYAGREFGLLRGLWEILWMYNRMRVNRIPLRLKLSVLIAASSGLFYRYKKYIQKPDDPLSPIPEIAIQNPKDDTIAHPLHAIPIFDDIGGSHSSRDIQEASSIGV